jgi:hypothetical protein
MLRLADALAELLDVLSSSGAWLDRNQAATVLAALADVGEGIRRRAASCPACTAHLAELCDECAGRLARAETYHALAARLRELK